MRMLLWWLYEGCYCFCGWGAVYWWDDLVNISILQGKNLPLHLKKERIPRLQQTARHPNIFRKPRNWNVIFLYKYITFFKRSFSLEQLIIQINFFVAIQILIQMVFNFLIINYAERDFRILFIENKLRITEDFEEMHENIVRIREEKTAQKDVT